MLRLGLVDYDTSHVVAFTQRLNGIDCPPEHRVEGARVVAGWPGDSAIMPERIPGYAKQLADWGIAEVAAPTDLIGRIDGILIESQQGARHLERVRPFLEAGVSAFVDKPFAGSLAEADAMIALARTHKVPLMSCSSLRYDPVVTEAIALQEKFGALKGVEVWGPCALHDGNPGLLHYGIHMVEMLYTLMGVGCREVRTIHTPGTDVVTGVWNDGRVGIVRGIRDAGYAFGLAAHYEKGQHVAKVEGSAYYTEMLKAVVGFFATKTEPIPLAETREITAFMEAAWVSALDGARPVEVNHGS